MVTVGEKLRQARAARALTLEQAAASTRIPLKYLEAMEADNRAVFPGGFFYKSFVMQYAGMLGLKDPYIAAYIDEALAAEAPLPLPGQEPNEGLRTIKPLASRRSNRLAVPFKFLVSVASFIIVVTVCAGVYSWWDQQRFPLSAVAAVRPQAVKAPSPVVAQAQTPVEAPAQKPAEAPPPTPAPAQPQKLVEVQAQTSAPIQPETPAPTQTKPEQPVQAIASAKLSLNLAASEATWLSLSSDGKSVFNGVLEANQTKSVAAEEQAKVVVGNAGGVSVEWNGRDIGTLGKRGQVRVVTFTPQGYHFANVAQRTRPSGERVVDSTR
jgi:cytoskeleton protein RodZ